MSSPIVSIIIPVYNRPVLVAEAIESVLVQTNPNWELIVVDDGSTDHTWEVLESYAAKDERIRVFKRDREPKGAPTCRNIGAGLAKGEYLIFWDSDDLLFPWCVDQLIYSMEQNKDVECGVFQQLVNNPHEKDIFWYRAVADTPEGYIKRLTTFQVAFSTHSVIWRKEAFEKSNRWNEEIKAWQDPELHIKAILSGLKFRWLEDEPLGIIRLNLANNQISLNSRIAVFSKHLKEILELLPSGLKKPMREAVKSKFWENNFYAYDFNKIKEDIKTLWINNLVNGLEAFFLLVYFYFYHLLKRVPFVFGFYYRLGSFFYVKKKFFEKTYLSLNDKGLIKKKVENIYPNKSQTDEKNLFLKTNLGKFF